MSKQASNPTRPKPTVLCILDGWGDREGGEDNAIHNGHTPNWDRMRRTYPGARLQASSLDVGLPEGQMGNSEVGHMNIGAGRVVIQDLPLIDAAIADGSIGENPALLGLIDALRASGGACHIIGLASPGGVHSHQAHLIALAGYLDAAGIETRLHAFLDGRDVPPSSALGFVEDIAAATASLAGFELATVSGRYYAMDRDNNWDRIERAYRALADGEGQTADSAAAAIRQSYESNVMDEFVEPWVIGGYAGMADGDGLLMFNFRADRAREVLSALVEPDFDGFDRRRAISFAARTGMTEYSGALNRHMTALFPQRPLKNILGQVVSDAGLSQLRIAETEKYAHVTFFLNGGAEDVFPGEERILVPSPKVATYDLQPEMSAIEVTDKLVEAIQARKYDLIVVNYANGDMVGHTGIFDAAVRAAETVDACLGRLETVLRQSGGAMLVTADHGNAERMLDTDNDQPHTAHTLSPVPVMLVNPPAGVNGLSSGLLADVSPTILQLMNLPQPPEMSGRSLMAAADRAHPGWQKHAPA
ncbi:MAG: 2,3-bisphosphoglycerate-independent phosphoglycerate mutase [Rhodospirillales bacterium]|jgi:2,3-bisphosphoglycerate-independent phosphoglycerate mutase|nr:2,3-bisphosphoglycerate-independent phosphoglycerate mutase [Rhodospirillales bacterium]